MWIYGWRRILWEYIFYGGVFYGSIYFMEAWHILQFQERLSDQYSISLPEYGVLEVPQHHPHHYNQ